MHRSHRAAPSAVCFVAEASARLKTPITAAHVIMCVHRAIRLHANFASASMVAASARRSTSVINAGHLETAVRAKNTTALHKELANVNLLTTLLAMPVATAMLVRVSARRRPQRRRLQRQQQLEPQQPRHLLLRPPRVCSVVYATKTHRCRVLDKPNVLSIQLTERVL